MVPFEKALVTSKGPP